MTAVTSAKESPPASSTNPWGTVVLLGSLTAMGPLGIDMYLSTLPAMEASSALVSQSALPVSRDRASAKAGARAPIPTGATTVRPVAARRAAAVRVAPAATPRPIIEKIAADAGYKTTRIATEMAAALRTEPEIRDYQIYAGTAAPFNFNGLVRHYFMRRGANVADIQVNLLPKGERRAQSGAKLFAATHG